MNKTVYLVRHGESEDNVAETDGGVYKGPNAALTERGWEQARFVAKRCEDLDIDVIVASTFLRAKETAGAIAGKNSKPVEYSDLFVERRASTDRVGTRTEGMAAIRKTIDANLHVPGFKHLDEEGAEDIQNRAGEALAYLENRPEKNILVVSHAMFLRALMARVLFGDDITIRETAQCMRLMRVSNAGLSIIQYFPDDAPYGPWRLFCWNDHAHLG